MPTNLDPQLALDETAITNPDLEAALERRLRAQQDVTEVRGTYKVHHKEATRLIEAIADFEPDTALRVGRFRITKTHIDGRDVSFTTEPRDQLRIGLVEDGEASAPVRTAKPAPVDDDADLRPTGEVNPDALRGEADRSSKPVGFRTPKGGDQPPVTH